MTSSQKQILGHLKTFLTHRGISIQTEEIREMGGAFAERQPEDYIYLEADGYQFFIYEDGQSEIRRGKESILNLEIESFDTLQELESRLFEKLSKLFGPLHSFKG